jgi:hypothetical protein
MLGVLALTSCRAGKAAAELATFPAGFATNVKEAVVTNAGHWVMEQQPAQMISLIRGFLGSPDWRGHAARQGMSMRNFVTLLRRPEQQPHQQRPGRHRHQREGHRGIIHHRKPNFALAG